MKKNMLFWFFNLAVVSIYAQNNIVIGGNYAFIPIDGTTVTSAPQYFYNEHHFALDAATDLNKYLRIGISGMWIRKDSPKQGQSNFYLAGGFAQLSLFPILFKLSPKNDRRRLTIALNIKNGDFCTCGDYEPYRQTNLWWLGYEIGYSRQIYRNLWIDLAFENDNILQNIKGKYNFTHYVIGLDYYFNFKK